MHQYYRPPTDPTDMDKPFRDYRLAPTSAGLEERLCLAPRQCIEDLLHKRERPCSAFAFDVGCQFRVLGSSTSLSSGVAVSAVRMSITPTTDPKFLDTLESWLRSQPEIMVLIRYSHSAGATV